MHIRKLTVYLMLMFIVSLLLVPSVVAAPLQLQQDVKSDMNVAIDSNIEIAKVFVTRWANLDHPEWKNAKLENPQAYYDLDGNHIATVYTITDGKEPVGDQLQAPTL